MKGLTSVAEPTHAEIIRRLEAGDRRFRAIEAELERGSKQRARNAETLDSIKEAVSVLPELRRDVTATKDIVEAWAAVKTMGKFLKWSAGIIGAVSAIIVALKSSAAHFLR